jgi:hypothetical protein
VTAFSLKMQDIIYFDPSILAVKMFTTDDFVLIYT